MQDTAAFLTLHNKLPETLPTSYGNPSAGGAAEAKKEEPEEEEEDMDFDLSPPGGRGELKL